MLLLFAGCSRASADPTAEREQIQIPSATATRVETAVLKRSPASLRLTLPGEIEGIKDARLASSMGGYVETVHVKAGEAACRLHRRDQAERRQHPQSG